MLVAIADHRIVPGKEAQAERAFQENSRLMSGHKGFISRQVLKRDDDGQLRIVTVTAWERPEDRDSFRSSTAGQEASRWTADLFSEQPIAAWYEVIPV